MSYLIYRFISPSGKSYIGQTKNLKNRIKRHIKSNGCTLFHAAIQKYGFDKFSMDVLAENLTVDEANHLEDFYITKFNSLSPTGYNLRTGGKNYTVTDETRIKIGLSSKGRKHTQESKLKISQSLKGRTLWNEEQRLAISERQKGKSYRCVDYKHSEETKIKIGSGNKNKKISKDTREKMSIAAKKRHKSENSSMFVGVVFHKETKKWRATITIRNKTISLGLFYTQELANEARINAQLNI